MASVMQDIRFAIRAFRKSPGFALAVIVTLALGIGANTALFTLINAVLIRELPVQDPSRLVIAHLVSAGDGDDEDGFSYATFERIRDATPSLSGVAVFDGTRLSASVDGQPQVLWGQCVSGNFFDVLGVKPVRGRELSAVDDRPGAPPAVVISYAFWKRGLALDPAAVGKTILLKDIPFTIVGITREGFTGIEPGFPFDLFVPMTHWPRLRLNDHLSVEIIGRLRPGASRETARAEAQSAYLAGRTSRSSAPPPRFEWLPGGRGTSGLRDEFAQPLAVLMVAVGAVLLIACVNVANLLLARSSTREREMGLRLAMGASRGRLLRQLLTESVLLALLGGLLGLALAAWEGDALFRLVANGRLSDSLDLRPDSHVLVFTAFLSISIGILFGLAPALRAAAMRSAVMLREGSPTIGGGRRGGRVRAILVIVQVALCVVLLVGAGLLTRSLQRLFSVDPGFERDRVLLVSAYPTIRGYEGSSELALYERLRERLGVLSGVRSASLSRFPVLGGGRWQRRIMPPRAGTPQGGGDSVLCDPVSPGFFETMGIPLLLGRDLRSSDSSTAPHVVVVSEAFARAHFSGAAPLGDRIRFADGDESEIVGVVRDVRAESLREREYSPVVYVPIAQTPADRLGQVQIEIRTRGHAAVEVASLRREIQAIEHDLPVVGAKTQGELITESLGTERLMAALCGGFAILALVLACVGLYGVLAYSVAQRRQEIAIRAALGASPSDLLRWVLAYGVRLVAAGILLGLAVTPAAARLLSSLLFGISPADPLTLFGASLALLLVAIAASLLPARRAMRADPLGALRSG
jgi:predicted permease